VPRSLPSRGVMGMQLLLKSFAELAVLLSRRANDFRRGMTLLVPGTWRSTDSKLETDGGVR
jgi:hypothetical protein